MNLTSLQLTDYRNYHSLELCPNGELNVLVGRNGQGKSNILEAIYLLATTRSLRAHRDQELVRRHTELARVAARIDRQVRPELTVEIAITANQKLGRVNGVRHHRLIDLLGEFTAVQFAPTDVDLITGSPSQRRGFLNLQIAQARGGYAYALIYYRRVLDQRNRLLKDAARAGGMSAPTLQTLDALTEQLVLHGSQVMERRDEFVRSLASYADRLHRELAGSDSVLEVNYHPGGMEAEPARPATKERFEEVLGAARTDELRRGQTLVGPHRDDVQFLINGMDARTYASRGEQRTVALSLKLGEFLLLQELTGEPPVMLLDDVLSELDDERSMRVIRGSVGPCQCFLTGASLRTFPEEILSRARLFRIEGGRLMDE